MASGYHGYVAGEKPPAATINDFWSKQVVMVFTDSSARDTALSGILREGMRCYLLSTNCEQTYSGSVWSSTGPLHGVLSSWVPVVVQGAVTPTLTVTWGTYSRVGRQITCNFLVTITSAGSAGTDVSVSLPVAAATGSQAHGVGFIIDQSASLQYPGLIALASGTVFKFVPPATSAPPGTFLGASVFTAALANTDTVQGSFHYVAAADA